MLIDGFGALIRLLIDRRDDLATGSAVRQRPTIEFLGEEKETKEREERKK